MPVSVSTVCLLQHPTLENVRNFNTMLGERSLQKLAKGRVTYETSQTISRINIHFNEIFLRKL